MSDSKEQATDKSDATNETQCLPEVSGLQEGKPEEQEEEEPRGTYKEWVPQRSTAPFDAGANRLERADATDVGQGQESGGGGHAPSVEESGDDSARTPPHGDFKRQKIPKEEGDDKLNASAEERAKEGSEQGKPSQLEAVDGSPKMGGSAEAAKNGNSIPFAAEVDLDCTEDADPA